MGERVTTANAILYDGDFFLKMAEVMKEVGYVQKDATNDFQHYSYASAVAVMSAVNEAAASRGVVVNSHETLERFEVIPQGDKMKTLAVVKVVLVFTDGAKAITMEGLGCGIDSGDKSVMKANTAATKYALASGFLISWGDDPERESPTIDRSCPPAYHEPSPPPESPFSDDAPAHYAAAQVILARMKGKRGIRELREFFCEAQTATIKWEKVVEFAGEEGVDFSAPLALWDCTRLRDAFRNRGA